MNDKLKEFIESANLITLSGEEKRNMKAVLEARMKNTKEPLESRWNILFQFRQMAFAGTFIILFLFGSVSLASRDSKPGDAFYTFKLIGENILETLAYGEEAILEAKTAKAIARLDEAERLSLENKLDPVKEKQLEEMFTQISDETLLYIESLENTDTESDVTPTVAVSKEEGTAELTMMSRAVEEDTNSDTNISKETEEIDQRKERRENIKASFEEKLEQYKNSLNEKTIRPDRLIEKVDSVIARLHSDVKITYTNATSNLIVIELPFPGAVTGKDFSVIGEARGYWFFEASFPVEVLDKDGNSLAIGIAQAGPDPETGEINWMTENFVPFKADIKIPENYIGPATLILKKDNPSGLPQNDASISFPITIEY